MQLNIGNAYIVEDWPQEVYDEYDDRIQVSAYWDIRRPIRSPEAPHFPFSDKENCLVTSHWHIKEMRRGWKVPEIIDTCATFSDRVERLIMPIHAPDHVELKQARIEWSKKHPRMRAALCECKACGNGIRPIGPDWPQHDATASRELAIFDWLIWWSAWALANCERPALMAQF